MAVATFDTLKFANSLKSAGVPDKQAEAAAINEALAANFKELATKDDLHQVRTELKNEIREVEQRLNAKIDGVEQRLTAKTDTSSAKLSGDVTLLKYMLGIAVTLLVAVLIRLQGQRQLRCLSCKDLRRSGADFGRNLHEASP